MNARDMKGLLSHVSAFLRAVGANSSAENTDCLASVFDVNSTATMAQSLKKLANLDVADAGFLSTKVGVLVPVLSACRDVLRGHAKAATLNDLSALTEVLRSYSGCDLATFARVARATLEHSPAKKQAAIVRGDVVSRYVRRLEGALGDDPGFAQELAALESDGTVTSAEMIAIAKQFARSATKSRPAALNKIKGRHQSLMTSRAMGAATAGRVAG